MKESRLFHILYYLIEHGSSTAPALADKFEVSVRTIYRDIDVISSAGVPIYATQGKGGGICIANDFVLDKSLLSQKEQEHILMSLQGIMATGKQGEEELLHKLASLFQSKNINWIEVDFSNWIKATDNPSTFAFIKEAIFNHTLLSFQYFGATGSASSRKIAPFKLVFKSKDWYVYGYCFLRKEMRFFKLTRIKHLQSERGEFPQEMHLPATLQEDAIIEDSISVVLKFHKDMAFRVYDEFCDEVQIDAQGNFIVHTKLPNNEMLFSYIFSFLDGVEVLQPTWVREALHKKIMKLYTLYKT